MRRHDGLLVLVGALVFGSVLLTASALKKAKTSGNHRRQQVRNVEINSAGDAVPSKMADGEEGEEGTNSSTVKKPHVVFASIGIRGHAMPLLRMAEELSRRSAGSIKVSFATHHRAREWVKSKKIHLISLGRFPVRPSELRGVLGKVSADRSMFRGLLKLFNDLYLPSFQPVYDELLQSLQAEMPTIMVVDIGTVGAFDVATKLRIPVILNSPTFPFSVDGSSNPWLPSFGSGFSIDMSLWDRCMNILYPRLLSVALTPAFIRLNKVRYANGLPCYESQHDIFRGTKMLVNTAFGLDHARKLPSSVEMVGPILPSMHARHDQNAVELPKTVAAWLELPSAYALRPHDMHDVSGQTSPSVEDDEDREIEVAAADDNDDKNEWSGLGGGGNKRGPPAVVFVNFGWMPKLEKDQLSALISGLTDPRLLVLWPMSNEQMKTSLSTNLPLTFQVVNRLGAANLRVLEHPNVKVVVSHCGLGVAQEALMHGKPLLCLPLFGDQPDVAARVRDANAGRVLNKARLSAADVRRSVLEIVRSNKKFSREAKRVGMLLKYAGGVDRAADVIESYLEQQLAMLRVNQSIVDTEFVEDPNQNVWYRYRYVDVYAVCFAVISLTTVLVYILFRGCVKCMARLKTSVGSAPAPKSSQRRDSQLNSSAEVDSSGMDSPLCDELGEDEVNGMMQGPD
mgnify:CR=1 FL=1|jgi:UDP:flavonoid glycosyltransferase YjiC (YdhE family)